MHRTPSSAQKTTAQLSRFARLKRDDSGTTAIEFAIVAFPFFMFVFGIIGISMHYFVMNSLEKGMDQASRMIRTGQAQSGGWTVGQFEKFICNKANSREGSTATLLTDMGDGHVKCNDLQVFLQRHDEWSEIAPQPCVNADGTKVVNNTNKGDELASRVGGANDVVVVTMCYEWDFTTRIPFLRFDTADGAMVMQAATSFRTEPYTAN